MILNKIKNECKNCAKKSKDTIKKHKTGKIKLEKAMRIVKNCIEKCGIDYNHWDLNEQKELTSFLELEKKFLRPYEEGDNSNRSDGFGENPYNTIKGQLFQGPIKQGIRKAIHMSEWLIKFKYNKDAFVYEDPRLIDLDEFMEEFINKHFQHAEYKLEFMHQLRHIVFFMVKEDPYYTNVFYYFCNQFINKYKDGFEMTEKEKMTFDIWHIGDMDEIYRKQKEYNEKRQKGIA